MCAGPSCFLSSGDGCSRLTTGPSGTRSGGLRKGQSPCEFHGGLSGFLSRRCRGLRPCVESGPDPEDSSPVLTWILRCSRLTTGPSGTRSGGLRKGQSPCEFLGGLSGFLSRRCRGLRPCVESGPDPEDSSPVLTWILRCSRLTTGPSGTRSGGLRKGQSPCEFLGGLSGFLSRRCRGLRPCVESGPDPEDSSPVLTWILRCSRLTTGPSGTRSGGLRKGQSPCEFLGGLSGFLSRRCRGLRPCVESGPDPEDSSPVLTWILRCSRLTTGPSGTRSGGLRKGQSPCEFLGGLSGFLSHRCRGLRPCVESGPDPEDSSPVLTWILRRRKRGSPGCVRDPRASSRVETGQNLLDFLELRQVLSTYVGDLGTRSGGLRKGQSPWQNLLDFLELRQVLSTYDGDLRDPLWWPQERPVPMKQGKDPSSRARRRKRCSPGGVRDPRASSRVETGQNLLDFLELRQVLSTYDGDLRDPLWWPQERPVPMKQGKDPSSRARRRKRCSPGGVRDPRASSRVETGQNLLDFLELRQVLSTYDGDLRDPLWWPQERPVPMKQGKDPSSRARRRKRCSPGGVRDPRASSRVETGALDLRRGPQGPALVASGKASPHASSSGASRDSSPIDAGA
ncbi:hypothetical protein MJT46_011066 [Ovis ammon polii x Ovis aries]|nr:hypothetical protein MJT46_011066 [Ovis ammon polii x Ovis aries]